MTGWIKGTPELLLQHLRPGGWLIGRSPCLPYHVRLHKTDFIETLKLPVDPKLPPYQLTWKILNPDKTGHWDSPRRTVVIWLGGKDD